jgi:hypothetical protein
MRHVVDDSSSVKEAHEAISEFAQALYAVGYEEDHALRVIRANIFGPLAIGGFDDIRPDECPAVIARAKQLLRDHLIDVALARAYETTWDVIWPTNAYNNINAGNTFRMRDLLDVRMGCEAAKDLVHKVQAQLDNCARIKKDEPLEQFLENRRVAKLAIRH